MAAAFCSQNGPASELLGDLAHEPPRPNRMTRTTIGIDLASQPKNTGVCAIAWNPADSGAGEVVETSGNAGASDEDLRLLLDRADTRVGIDVPLGWPTRFSDSVATYSRGGKCTVRHGDCRLRATDIWLTEELTRRGLRRIVPLSVAADLIAMPAMRAAHLLSAAGLEAMPRDGSARIVEVYPAEGRGHSRPVARGGAHPACRARCRAVPPPPAARRHRPRLRRLHRRARRRLPRARTDDADSA